MAYKFNMDAVGGSPTVSLVDGEVWHGESIIGVGASVERYAIRRISCYSNAYYLWFLSTNADGTESADFMLRFSIVPDELSSTYAITIMSKEKDKKRYESERYLRQYEGIVSTIAYAIILRKLCDSLNYRGLTKIVTWEPIHTNAVDFLMEKADETYTQYTRHEDIFSAGECAGYILATRMLLEEFLPNDEIICGRFKGNHEVRRKCVRWEMEA